MVRGSSGEVCHDEGVVQAANKFTNLIEISCLLHAQKHSFKISRRSVLPHDLMAIDEM